MSQREENLVQRRVHAGARREIYIVENVPARVNEETGEQFCAPATVERLQRKILGQRKPDRIVETPVYEYAD